jgi:hypothetical protein
MEKHIFSHSANGPSAFYLQFPLTKKRLQYLKNKYSLQSIPAYANFKRERINANISLGLAVGI